ncbi:PSD1 and planctomycete cytochrome C domain-containing protein [Rhodopirellula sp.]|nr:PSD1 and planctomycete cytochrome C domain-containing protein [Rhodopirellula sp.]MDB4532754.1 PSD1 and planctomycete cytochrome C domain-containing protein [bacterium]
MPSVVMRLHLALLCFFITISAVHAADVVNFNRDIKPILSDKCYACHGPDEGQRQGGSGEGLRFDIETNAKSDLGGYAAIVPGKLDDSELVRRILSDDPDEVMPPPEHNKNLTPTEIARLKNWISQGAQWSGHWAYEPLNSSVERTGNWIDELVQRQLSSDGISASAKAEDHILTRRLFFDLVGLPPSKGELDAFLKDTSKDAWEQQIDRLLASPHFGERMAIYWLDLVRYADTVGYHGDQDVSVSPFRDYIINAFNSNMPFDQFTREQLAGDLLTNPTQPQLIASGYNKLGMMSAEGGAQPKEYLTKYASDRVRTASTVWLGSTLGCAECHDHKFDPFTQKDFYQFASFFADIKERGLYAGANRDGAWGPSVKVADDELAGLLKAIDSRLAEMQDTYESTDVSQPFEQWVTEQQTANTTWKPMVPSALSALHETKLVAQPDHSILASGPGNETNTYRVTLKDQAEKLNGIRIEVLPHDSLPKKGPGRAGNGNFVISEVKVHSIDADGKRTPLKLANAKASFEQADGNTNPYKGWKAIAAIDGDSKGATWGWAVMPQSGKPNSWIAEFETPLKPESPISLLVEIDQNHTNPGHTLGCFRLSGTSGKVTLDPKLEHPADIQAVLAIAAEKRSDAQIAKLLSHYRTISPQLANIRSKIEATKKERTNTENAHTRSSLITQVVAPREMRVLPRGNWMDMSGEVVTPNVPHFLPQIEAKDERINRLDLANWLTAKDNPITARVFVNRLWKLFFGTGLSKVLDDIGSQGEYPSHPQLIDALAQEFIDSDWNIKHMVRLIVASQTYQQSSLPRPELVETDPFNRLLARQSRYRLDAELIRDNALAVSGLLVDEIGGRSVKPYQPAGLLRHLNFPRRTYKQDTGNEQYRRGVYTHWQRQFLHPAMKSFDAPAREECTAERPRSNTPLAALVLLNDPSYVEAARVFAEQLLASEMTTDEERITQAIRQALSRDPNEQEIKILMSLTQQQRAHYQSNPEAAKELIAVGLAPVNDSLDAIETAALLSATRAIMNMHEFITRN